MGRFNHKVVWITGASSGIGAALAKQFVREGAKVALSARRLDRLKELARTLGENAYVYPLDVQKKAMVDEIAQKIVDDHGSLDVVIANAGYGVRGHLETLTEEMWRNLFETNVFGVVWTVQAAIPHLKISKGRVAIMSSVAGKLAFKQGAAYSATKFALMGIANSLYLELHKFGVSVTTIAPGLVESEIGQVDNYGKLQEDRRAYKNFFVWPADRAAHIMLKAIHQRKREEIITGHGKIAAFLGTHLAPLTYWGMAKVNEQRFIKEKSLV